jgi:putative transposase
MTNTTSHRKRVKHYHHPGDCHELTFSCFDRKPLLADGDRCRLLSEYIDRAIVRHGFRLVAFVFMPEHVHLIVYPEKPDIAEVSGLLKGVKQPYARHVRKLLEAESRQLLAELTVRERPGKTAFRFWQEGGGFDSNLTSSHATLTAIDYIHMNAVKRGLVVKPSDWKWSSYRRYERPQEPLDPDLPAVHGLPAAYLL